MNSPSDLASADVRADALAVDAGLDAPLVQVLANGHRARVLAEAIRKTIHCHKVFLRNFHLEF